MQVTQILVSDTLFKYTFMRAHYSDVIMSAMASQISGVSIVCSAVCSGADQRKLHSPASPAFVRESTGDRFFPSQNASSAEEVSIWWCHRDQRKYTNSDCSRGYHWRESILDKILAWSSQAIMFIQVYTYHRWPLLLTGSNLDSSMDKQLHPL